MSMEEFDHLKVQFHDIIEATDNFSQEKLIGRGGFGLVYKGELSLPKGRSMLAFKCLDRSLGQGNVEFWKEIMMLSKYRHENLVPLVHFCIEGDESILAYEYASRGSLDRHLGDVSVTWIQRLKICVGVARALNFLHDPAGSQQRVVHRDIKSSNILLDENWTAKVSDFGLSKVTPANQPQTFIFSNVVGTPGYCDPLYFETGFLSKESDVYSFGVVLFEVMCGRLCYEYSNGQITELLVAKWRKYYEDKRLDEIIFHDLKEKMVSSSLDLFSAIAYQCLERAREKRPTMARIMEELEAALEQQEVEENLRKGLDFEKMKRIALEQQEVAENLRKGLDFEKMKRIAHLAVAPLSYTSERELHMLFLKGILVAHGKTIVSANEKGEIIELISSTKCTSYSLYIVIQDSRSLNIPVCHMRNISINVSTEFLSRNVTYNMNLVFKHSDSFHATYLPFTRILFLDEEIHSQDSLLVCTREDGWKMINLYQFTSNGAGNKHNFRIKLVSQLDMELPNYIEVEGIEFRPVEHVIHQNIS